MSYIRSSRNGRPDSRPTRPGLLEEVLRLPMEELVGWLAGWVLYSSPEETRSVRSDDSGQESATVQDWMDPLRAYPHEGKATLPNLPPKVGPYLDGEAGGQLRLLLQAAQSKRIKNAASTLRHWYRQGVFEGQEMYWPLVFAWRFSTTYQDEHPLFFGRDAWYVYRAFKTARLPCSYFEGASRLAVSDAHPKDLSGATLARLALDGIEMKDLGRVRFIDTGFVGRVPNTVINALMSTLQCPVGKIGLLSSESAERRLNPQVPRRWILRVEYGPKLFLRSRCVGAQYLANTANVYAAAARTIGIEAATRALLRGDSSYSFPFNRRLRPGNYDY